MAGYSEYLKLSELLSLQRPRSANHRSELAFIVVHQVYELWFKLLIEDLGAAIASLDDDDPTATLRHLRQVHEVERLLVEQLALIDHLEPGSFSDIRSNRGDLPGRAGPARRHLRGAARPRPRVLHLAPPAQPGRRPAHRRQPGHRRHGRRGLPGTDDEPPLLPGPVGRAHVLRDDGYFTAMMRESGSTSGATRHSVNPASLSQPKQSAAV
jgi:hypothetical protein